jgi:hypothetical protein
MGRRKTALARMVMIAGALTGLCSVAAAQPDGISSARPDPGEGRSGALTPEMVRRGQPMPLPRVDPDAVRAAARAEQQSGVRSSGPHVEGSSPPSGPQGR